MRLPIGLEISEQYLKLVVAKSGVAHPKPSDCIVEPILSFSDEQIANTIIGLLKKWKLKPKSLALCLSRNLVTVRNLHLPSQDDKEITQMIDLNIGRIVPYKKEEIAFGYRILGVDEMGYTKLILALVKSDCLRRQSEIIEKLGFFIDRIGLSSYGVWEWVLSNHHSEINQTDLYLILDIDSAFTDFIIFSYNNLLFTHSINLGANNIRDSQEIGITKLLGEVRQFLIMFYNEEINKKPALVFLSGANVKPDLSKTIETELEIPVKPVISLYPSEVLKSKEKDILGGCSLTGVASLALKDNEHQFYFLLPEIQIRKFLREKTKDLIILGTSLIYLFSMTCAIFLGKIYNQQSYLNKLNQRYRAIEKDLGDLLEQSAKIEFVKVYLAHRQLPLIVLSQLQKIIPDEISVNSVSIDEENRVTIRGQAVQLSDVFKFISTLESEKHFKDVQTKSTRKKKVKDKDLTDFELSFLSSP